MLRLVFAQVAFFPSFPLFLLPSRPLPLPAPQSVPPSPLPVWWIVAGSVFFTEDMRLKALRFFDEMIVSVQEMCII